MLKIKYELNGQKDSFDASLPYTMIGVKDNQLCYLFQNYDEVNKTGNKIRESFDIIPCTVEGVSVYGEKFPLEEFDPKRDKFVWVEPVKIEPIVPVVENSKPKKLRKARKKK